MPKATNSHKLRNLAAIKAAKDLLAALEQDGEFLESPIRFSVVTEESDPHDVEVLDVSIGPEGLTFETIEDDRTQRTDASFSWAHLLRIARTEAYLFTIQTDVQELETEIKELQAIQRHGDRSRPLKFERPSDSQ